MSHCPTPTIRDFSFCRAATESRASRHRSPVMSHRLAVDTRLRVHRRACDERHLGDDRAGNRIQLVPLNQFSWWNKYQFTPVWSAAVGAIYFSDSFASSDDSVKLPGFFRFDAAVYLKINEMWRAQINVENIFDKGYWASADGNNNLSPGQPRTVKVYSDRQVLVGERLKSGRGSPLSCQFRHCQILKLAQWRKQTVSCLE